MRLVADDRFEAYGPSHLTVLAIFAVGVVVVVVAGRRVRGRPSEQAVRRGVAVALLAVTVPLQILQLTPDEWDLQTSLPLQLCDLGWMFAAHALWTRNRLSATITYLWGITLTTQGMITPDIESTFPQLRFLMFWGMHLIVVWSAIFLVAGLRILPTWRTYRQTVAGDLGLGGGRVRLQRRRRHQLRLPQPAARQRVAAGPPGPLAAVRRPRDRDRRGRLGVADLAVDQDPRGHRDTLVVMRLSAAGPTVP